MATCTLCPGRTFRTTEALHQHKIDSKTHFYCQACMQDAPDAVALVEHFVSLHPARACTTCKRIFNSADALKKHLYDSPKHANCKLCHKGFLDDADYLAHKRGQHSRRRKSRRRMNSPAAKSPDSPRSSVSGDSMPPTPAHSVERLRQDAQLKVVSSPEVRDRSNGLSAMYDFSEAFPSEKQSHDQFGTQGSISMSNTTESIDISMFSSENAAELTPTTNDMGETSLFLPSQIINDSNDFENEDGSALDLQLSKHEMEFSPLLRSEEPLIHDSNNTLECSEDFAIPEDREVLSSGELDIHSSNSNLTQSGDCSEQITELASYSLLERRGNPLSEEMKNSWKLRLDEANASSSRCSPSQLLQAISSLSPTHSLSPTTADDSRIYSISDSLINYRRSPLRPRRLSQSPTLPSIPETPPSIDEHQGDSDTESSLGIYEHWADAYLVDNTSEEQSVTSPTYHSAYGGNDEDYEDEEEGAEDEERDNFSFASYPSPPALVIEDLTQLAREICISPYGDQNDDPFADPFELHPSATNSPMDTIFHGRPRAWSVGPPEKEPVESDQEEQENKPEAQRPVRTRSRSTLSVASISASLSEGPGTISTLSSPQFAEENHPLRKMVTLQSPAASERQWSVTSASTSGPTLAESAETMPVDIPKLHCRICHLNPCREPTATFCGHVFCYGCISREVMEKSKCPTCMSPTLLYCLFKLDLS